MRTGQEVYSKNVQQIPSVSSFKILHVIQDQVRQRERDCEQQPRHVGVVFCLWIPWNEIRGCLVSGGMRSGTYAEIVQLCQRCQPRPVFVDGLVGKGGENLPVDCVYLCWRWRGLWWICGSGGLLRACRRWCGLVGLCGGHSGSLRRWGWQISGGHRQGRVTI